MIRLDPSSGTLQELVIDAETGGSHGRRRIDLVGQDGSFSGRFGGGHEGIPGYFIERDTQALAGSPGYGSLRRGRED